MKFNYTMGTEANFYDWAEDGVKRAAEILENSSCGDEKNTNDNEDAEQ